MALNKKYYEIRNVDDSYEKTTPYWLTKLQKKYFYNKNLHILDIGCGNGYLLENLSREGYTNLYGIDLELSQIKLNSKVKYSILNSSQLYKIKQKFDVIMCFHVLEHLETKDLSKTMEQIVSSLNNNGVLIVAVPNAQSPLGCYWRYEDITHRTMFTCGSIKSLLRMYGFRNLQIVDRKNTESNNILKKLIKQIKFYVITFFFWFVSWLSSSSFHNKSENSYGFEIKIIGFK